MFEPAATAAEDIAPNGTPTNYLSSHAEHHSTASNSSALTCDCLLTPSELNTTDLNRPGERDTEAGSSYVNSEADDESSAAKRMKRERMQILLTDNARQLRDIQGLRQYYTESISLARSGSALAPSTL